MRSSNSCEFLTFRTPVWRVLGLPDCPGCQKGGFHHECHSTVTLVGVIDTRLSPIFCDCQKRRKTTTLYATSVYKLPKRVRNVRNSPEFGRAGDDPNSGEFGYPC